MKNPDSVDDINRRRFFTRVAKGALLAATAGTVRVGYQISEEANREEVPAIESGPKAETSPTPKAKDLLDEDQLKDFLVPASFGVYRDDALRAVYGELAQLYDAYPNNRLREVSSIKYHQLETARQNLGALLYIKIDPEVEDLVLGMTLVNSTSNLCQFSQQATEKLLDQLSRAVTNLKLTPLDWNQSNISQKISEDPVNNLMAACLSLQRLISLYRDPGLAIAAFQFGEKEINDAIQDAISGRPDLANQDLPQIRVNLVNVVYNNTQIGSVYKVFAGTIIARREKRAFLGTARK